MSNAFQLVQGQETQYYPGLRPSRLIVPVSQEPDIDMNEERLLNIINDSWPWQYTKTSDRLKLERLWPQVLTLIISDVPHALINNVYEEAQLGPCVTSYLRRMDADLIW